jgi:predicted kinase
MRMKHMIIMRGGPGSGKTTIARKMASVIKADVLSADDYWLCDGRYEFKPSELGQAHAQCFRRTVYAVVHQTTNVVIDNTNSRAEEYIAYLALAVAFGYTVQIVRVLCDPEVAFARQIHDVPQDKFEEITYRVLTTQTHKMYRGAPWITEEDVRTDGIED